MFVTGLNKGGFILKNFKSSMENLKNIRTITTCAILMAFAVVLSFFTIYVNTIKISFYGIITALVGFIFGPFVSGIFGGVLDILQHFVKPNGSFQICWTFNSVISGLIYGFGLYKKTPTLKRILIVRSISGILVSVILTTVWLCIYYGIGKIVNLPITFAKELVVIFVQSIILHRIIKILKIKSK